MDLTLQALRPKKHEAFANALKYAQATPITLHLTFTPGQVQLRVQDER